MSRFSGLNVRVKKTVWFSKATLSERGPDFSRAKLVILSHADWFECIWMTVLTPPGISSCLCARLESELHFKESPMFILASPSEPWRRGPTHLYAALARSSPCSNWLTNINKIFFFLSFPVVAQHYTQIIFKYNTWLSLGSLSHTELAIS